MKFATSSVVALLLAVPGIQACGVTESTEQRCYSAQRGETPQNIDRDELNYIIGDLNRRGAEIWTQTNCAEWTVMRLSGTQALTRKFKEGNREITKSDIAKSLEWIRDNCGTDGGAMVADNGILVKLTRV
ncbi:hypothetical protein CDD83_2833 [Cordyceps sp. RAO-2017]|nr:hypothetical protein CDD83_2833 [Cordyceps sp. RAO-2017]